MDDREAEQPSFDVAGLPAFEWDSGRAVSYEVALEAVNAAVAEYQSRIYAEQQQPAPDATAIAGWRAEVQRCVAVRNGLDARDQAAVTRTRDEFSDLVRALRAR